MKLTPKLAQALTNLRGNRDFAVVLEGLHEHALEELTRCTDGDGTPLYRAQGATKALKWWTDSFRDAPTQLDKFNQQAQQGKNTP